MSKTNAFENSLLLLVFNNADIANIGDAAGLQNSAAAGSLYLSLHTADPGEAGGQNTNEVSYTSYARVAVARSGSGWIVTGNSVSPTAAVNFPTGAGGSGTAIYFGVGTDASGAGTLLFKGAITPSIVCGNGVTPQLSTATSITED